MGDPHRIVGFSLSIISTTPLRGIVDLDTGDSTMQFELGENIANNICTLLDRFLTQGQRKNQIMRSEATQ